jgi:hypothetical protein
MTNTTEIYRKKVAQPDEGRVMVDRTTGRDRETAVALSWAWEF